MKGLPGPILADVAANVLAMTLMVLIAVARMAQTAPDAPPPVALSAHPVVPLGGAEAVELLRQRLLPGTQGLADLTADTGPLPDQVTTLFILDPSAYPRVQAALATRSTGWQELTVPQALKSDDNHWHPDFLALAEVASDPDRFRTGLELLLARRQQSGTEASALGGGSSDLQLRFARWFATALQISGLAALFATFWGLTRLRRWALKA